VRLASVWKGRELGLRLNARTGQPREGPKDRIRAKGLGKQSAFGNAHPQGQGG